MPGSDPVAELLDVPGARLYYERRGSGPLASALAGAYTVMTYDPRGTGNISRAARDQDVTPDRQAGDVRRQLSALGGGPAQVFGSSGGAVVGLALVACPGQVRTLVAHEPTVIQMLPDRAQAHAQIQDIAIPITLMAPTRRWPGSSPTPGLAGMAAARPGAWQWDRPPEQARCRGYLRLTNDCLWSFGAPIPAA